MVIHTSAAAAAVLSWMAGDDLIETLTIGRHHILHITCVLQTTLYLQGAHTRSHQFLQMVYLAKVFEREQVLVVDMVVPLSSLRSKARRQNWAQAPRLADRWKQYCEA